MRGSKGSVLYRLRNKFTVGDECWDWTATRNNRGYGMFYKDGKSVLAHRVLYELMIGPIPENRQINHRCENKGCVRPDHLEPVSPRENMLYSDTVAARHRAKTHCPQGHEYSADNTIENTKGQRRCKACHYEKNRARYHRRQGRA